MLKLFPGNGVSMQDDDDVAEVSDIEGLAQVASIAGQGKHRGTLHEAGEPSEMFAIEPAEHQGRSKHAN